MKTGPAAAAQAEGAHGLLGRPLLLALGLMACTASGQAEAPPFVTRERLHQPLGPLAEKALAGLADAAEPHQRTLLADHMARVLEDMQGLLELTDTERKALDLDAVSMVSAALKTWKQCVAVDLRPLLRKQGDDDAAQAASVAAWKAEQLVPYYVVRHWSLPDQQAHWQKALERRLGTQRAALWQKTRSDERASLRADMDVFLKRWADAGRSLLDEKLEENLRLLRSAVPLTQDQAAGLTNRLRKLVDDHVTVEIEAGRDMLESLPDHVLLTYLSMKSMDLRFIRPSAEELDTAWRQQVVQTAGEKAMKDGVVAMERWRHAEAVRIANLLQPSEERALKQMKESMASKVDELVAVLELEERRRQKLETLAEKAMAENLEAVRVMWRDRLAQQEKEEGKPLRHTAYELNGANDVEECSVWREGLKSVLSEEETKRLLQSPAVRLQGMSRALAKTTVAEMDRLLGLNARQRAALEPLVEPHMKGMVEPNSDSQWSIYPPNLLGVLREVPEAQMQAVLDEAQMEQWKSQGKRNGDPLHDPFAPQNPAPANPVRAEVAGMGDEAPISSCEDSAVTKEISSYLYERTVIQRDSTLKPMLPLVEDARRVLGLSSERVAMLMTAAKGAVEAAMTTWRAEMEQLTQEQVAGATQENLETVLVSMDSIHVAVSKKRVMDQPEWQQGLSTLLSQAEREAWQEAVAERQAYRVTAMAMMTSAELDRLHRLGPKQCAKIEKLVAAAINKDLRALVDGPCVGEIEDWSLSCQFVLMPLGGVDKPQLRSVLTPRQWTRLRDLNLDDAGKFWKHVTQLPQNGGVQQLLPPAFLANPFPPALQ